MAVVTVLNGRSKFSNGLDIFVGLTFSGSYPANGEPLDFATLSQITNRQPSRVEILANTAAVVFTYDKVLKTIRIWCNSAGGANGVLTEHTTAGYIASVTGDVQIEARATFRN